MIAEGGPCPMPVHTPNCPPSFGGFPDASGPVAGITPGPLLSSGSAARLHNSALATPSGIDSCAALSFGTSTRGWWGRLVFGGEDGFYELSKSFPVGGQPRGVGACCGRFLSLGRSGAEREHQECCQ